MSKWLDYNIVPQLQAALAPQILGFILFAWIPAMTATRILDPGGQAYPALIEPSCKPSPGN